MKFPKCERKYVVICENVQCMASVGNYSYSKEKAIEAWNTRKPMQNIVERLEIKLSDTVYEKATQESNESHLNGLSIGYCEAIGIIKEEGDLNE